MESWIEIGKLVASIATPLVVAVFGILLLRRVEGIKALVAKQSDFQQKWADEFFSCCQQFMQTLERVLALLVTLDELKERNGKLGTEIQEEISHLIPKLSELELRIRSVVFAPISGKAVILAAQDCVGRTAQLLDSRKGCLDDIITKMNEFNFASRRAHAEMLGLDAASMGILRGAVTQLNRAIQPEEKKRVILGSDKKGRAEIKHNKEWEPKIPSVSHRD